MRDAVIGVVKNCDWPYLRNYAVSLSRCGFAGDKILFIDGSVTMTARVELEGLGFILPEYEAPTNLVGKQFNSWEDAMAWGFFGRWRFRPVIDWLKPRIDEYRHIVWCDVRDVMFQTNPSDWLQEQPAPGLYGAAEGCLIGDQPHNANWVSRTAPDRWEEMKKEEVCCSGTFAGDANTMLKVFEHMYSLHKSVKDPAAFDQGLWNVTARTSPFSEVFKIPKMKEGFCATGWPSKAATFSAYTTDQEPVWNWEDMVCYAPETSVPFSIVHQYDRETAWRTRIDAIMKGEELPPLTNPLILIVSCEAYRHNGIQDAIRETWAKTSEIPYRFLLGRGCENPAADELIVDADDDYASICWKQREAYKVLISQSVPFTHVFTCCTDTYVIPDRLLRCGFEAFSYCGSAVVHAGSVMGSIPFAQGGAGFWLDKKALTALANDKSCRKLPPDIWAAYVLVKHGIPLAHSSQAFWTGFPTPEPFESDKCVTMHLSQGTGNYDPAWMRDTHYIYTHTAKLPIPKAQPVFFAPAAVYEAHIKDNRSDIGHYLPFLRENAKGNILEIGVRGGASTAAFLLGLEKHGGCLYSVDIEDCRVFTPREDWKFLKASSRDHKAVLDFVPDAIDVLFIDGDHSREGFVNDLHTYSKLVRPGGMIICHDTDTSSNPDYTIEKGHPEAPSEAIREEYLKFAKDRGYKHRDLPGKCGMGVIYP